MKPIVRAKYLPQKCVDRPDAHVCVSKILTNSGKYLRILFVIDIELISYVSLSLHYIHYYTIYEPRYNRNNLKTEKLHYSKLFMRFQLFKIQILENPISMRLYISIYSGHFKRIGIVVLVEKHTCQNVTVKNNSPHKILYIYIYNRILRMR